MYRGKTDVTDNEKFLATEHSSIVYIFSSPYTAWRQERLLTFIEPCQCRSFTLDGRSLYSWPMFGERITPVHGKESLPRRSGVGVTIGASEILRSHVFWGLAAPETHVTRPSRLLGKLGRSQIILELFLSWRILKIWSESLQKESMKLSAKIILAQGSPEQYIGCF